MEEPSVIPLPAPVGLRLLVGWTGSPASTERLVEDATNAALSAENTKRDEAFLAESRECVDMFTETLLSQSLGTPEQNVSLAVRRARTLLQRLGEDRGITIETDTLRELCTIAEEHDAAAKPSGAGGGDCGIAFAAHTDSIPGILREWKQRGIMPLNLEAYEPSHTTEGAADES